MTPLFNVGDKVRIKPGASYCVGHELTFSENNYIGVIDSIDYLYDENYTPYYVVYTPDRRVDDCFVARWLEAYRAEAETKGGEE